MDRLSELIEQLLVALGISLSRLSSEEKTMITLLLVFLLVAAAIARTLAMAARL